jgi:cobalt-zinc-cadmium efflux system outer membrane protein
MRIAGWRWGVAPVMVFALAALAAAADAAKQPSDPGMASRVLTFAQSLELMEVRNREVVSARRAVRAADADRLAANVRPNPNLAFTTAAIHPGGVGAGGQGRTVDAIVQLSQLVERGDKRALRDDTARLLAESAQLDVDAMRRAQTTLLAQVYYALVAAQSRVNVADDTATSWRRLSAAADLRLKAGDLAPADRSRLRVEAERVEADRRAAVAERDRARGDLAWVLGLDDAGETLVAVESPLPAGDAIERPADLAARIDARPDVRAAQRRVDAAMRALDLARSLRTRDVTVAVQYEHYAGQDQNNTIGLGASVPLFVSNTYDGEIRRAEVDVETALDAVARARAAATIDVRRARTDLDAARDRVTRFDGVVVDEARRAADAAELAYRNGASGIVELLDALRTLAAVRGDAATARAELARALVTWTAAVAGPEERPR